MKTLLISLLLLTSAFASETRMKADMKKVDLKETTFKWMGSKPAGKHEGTIKILSGNLHMSKGLIKKGNIVLDMTSIDTTDLTGDSKMKLDGHLKSPDFFNVAANPTASLAVKSDNGKVLKADLTILGKTNLVNIPYTQKSGVYTGKLVFDRTKFGVVYKSKNVFKKLADKFIHDDITLNFKLVTK